MTIALFPRRVGAIGRLTHLRSAIRNATALLPALPVRKPDAAPTVNAGRWATLPGEYTGPWACPMDERLPAITASGTTAPIACGQSGAIILHLAGTWSGQVAFERSADGVTWHRVTLASFSGETTANETDRPGLWHIAPSQQIMYLRLRVARLSHGAILASVAAAPPVNQAIPRALDPAA